jgi:hypothetical protein
MRFSIEPRDGCLHATVYERDTAEQTREFLLAVHAAAKTHGLSKVLISIRQSRAIFKPEDYGLETGGYANALVAPGCPIALLGDTHEVSSANEYIEMVARQQGLNVRAFRDEGTALRWLNGAGVPSRRYRFTRIVIAGSPDEAGVYALWDGEEVIYYGRAEGENATIRSRLLDHYYGDSRRATHYSWEVCKDPRAREAELLGEHERAFGRLPRDNKKAA